MRDSREQTGGGESDKVRKSNGSQIKRSSRDDPRFMLPCFKVGVREKEENFAELLIKRISSNPLRSLTRNAPGLFEKSWEEIS
jgi:hypothetical protein